MTVPGPGAPAGPPDPLSKDRLLRSCTRIEHEGVPRPVLGRVLLTQAVGRGGMGAVYRGIHRTLGHERAVKVLLASADDSARERFLREARFAAHIDSPHLVRVHDADEDPASGLVYLEMEFVRGTSAAQWMREAKGGVSEDQALTVCLAATRGLEAAHTEGVVHRDVKPGNILIPAAPDGRPLLAAAKVADLGLARREEGEASLTATHVFVGTPGYAAPEQISDAKRAGKPADVFSMGATLYALLSGRSPFEGTSTSDTIVRTTLGKRTPLADLRPGVSAATHAVIDRCLALDPSARYPDATALRAALEACVDSESEAPTIGPPSVTVVREAPTVASPPDSRRPEPPPPLLAPATETEPAFAGPATPTPPPAPASPPVAAAPAVAAPPTGPGLFTPTAPATPPASGFPVGLTVLLAVSAVAGIGLVVWFAMQGGARDAAETEESPVAPAPENPEPEPEPAPPTPAPAPQGPSQPADAPAPAATRLTVNLVFVLPGCHVFLGDEMLVDGDEIPAGTESVRVVRPGYLDQTVPVQPNAKGVVYVKPGEWTRARGKVAVAPLPEGVLAWRNGLPVLGSIEAAAGEEVEVEFRRRGFAPQTVRETAAAGGLALVRAPTTWTWNGETPYVVPAGTKIRFEMSSALEGEAAMVLQSLGGNTPGSLEWEVEGRASSHPSASLRIRLTRIRGRAATDDGPLDFDSASPSWRRVVSEYREEIAEVSPVDLYLQGPIDVECDPAGRPTRWTPFDAGAEGLPGASGGDPEEMQRNTVLLLLVRPDLAGSGEHGTWTFDSATASSARVSATLRDESSGAEARSTLDVNLRDGLGTSFDVRFSAASIVVRVSARRK